MRLFVLEDGSAEWYTPPELFTALACSFDLDPCFPSNGIPTWIPARHRITPPDDGLAARWQGSVWLNPPYGRETGRWLDRLTEHGNGIALVFARTDAAWFQRAATAADAINFLAGRIRFIDIDGRQAKDAIAASALLAWGERHVEAIARIPGLLVHTPSHR